MAVSYAFAVGSIRARETSLLTRADMDQFIAAGSPEQLFAQLRDRGIGTGNSADAAADIDGLLRQDTIALWAYLRDIVPESAVFDAFLYRHDVHNAKAILKGVLSGRPYENLLLEPATIPPDDLRRAVDERTFTHLPAWLSDALQRAYDVLAHTGDPQLCDALIDRAGMQAMQETARHTDIAVLIAVVEATVFYADVKIALRAARAEKDTAFLDAALCPCEGVDRPAWIGAARQGESELLTLLEKVTRWDCRQAVEAYRHSPAAFERFVDDRLMAEARRAKYVTLGAAPVIGYLLAREAQTKALHIVASGLRTGQSEETIRERMRMLYD